MKKTTPQKLSNRLAQYGALSLAIAGVVEANGQIVYNNCDNVCNPNLPFMGGIGDEFLLDLDGDGTDDFRIHHNENSSIGSFSSSLFLQPLNDVDNEALGTFSVLSSYFAFPYALNIGDPISNMASGNWMNNSYSSAYMSLNYGSQAGTCSVGYWCDVDNKYLGLRFDISGVRHYGWVKLRVDPIGDVWVIKGYAYEKSPGVLINAGDGDPSLGIDDNIFSGVKIVALNKSIALYNLPQTTSYRLFSLTGQSVLDGKITNNTHVIEANTLATGIYIIELKDKTSNAVIRKKIVL